MNLLKNFGLFTLRSQLHAGLLALVFSLAPIFGIPLVAWVAIMIIGLVTLRHGAGQGFIVLVWSAVPSLVMVFLSTDMYFFSQVLCGGLIVWFLALLLRAHYPWSVLLEIAAWLAIVVVLVAHLAFGGEIYAWWAAKLHALIAQYNQAIVDEDVELMIPKQALFYVTHIATGFLTAMVCLNAVFNLLVARWWQALIFNPGGLSREFLTIRLSYRLVIGLIIAAVLAALRVEWAFDLLPIFLGAFFIAGFSLMNAWLMRFKRGWIWLLLFYILLLLRFMIIGAAVMVMAIVDSIVDIRKRWIVKKS